MNEELQKMVMDLYQQAGVAIDPKFPRVLVRVLPREQQTKGGIILPDGYNSTTQNKPVLEAIVLKTYEPFWQNAHRADEWSKMRSKQVVLDEHNKVKAIWQESGVVPGDHVIFPHMAFGIMPVWPLDDGKGDYRLVPEGEILGTLKYYKQQTREWLAHVINEEAATLPRDLRDGIITGLLLNADVIRKDVAPVTLSGR
jgi:hypothetical protein